MSNSSLTTVQANQTLDNTSPVFTWYPYGEGIQLGPTDGWVLWSSGLGYNTSPGQSPAGDMIHVTNRQNASVSLTYFGTSLYLFGSTNCTYSVTFDNVSQPSPSPSQGMLFSKTDVPLGMHTVNLTALPSNASQMLLFDRATFTTEANSSISNPTVATTNNQDTSVVTYQPASQWQSRTVANIPDGDNPQPFHYTNVPGSSATFDFYGRSIALTASLNYGHGMYSVNLDGVERILNGSSFWLVPNPVIFFADGLDETQVHHLNLTNLGEGQTLVLTFFAAQVTQYSTSLALAQANATQSQPTSKSGGGTNVGAIVGGVVGGVVFLFVVLFAWLFFRRRGEQEAPDSGNEKSSFLHTIFPTLYKGDGNSVTPFLSVRSPQSPSSPSTIYWNAPLNQFGENSTNGVSGKTGALAPLPPSNGDRKTPIVTTTNPIPVIMRKEPPPVVPRLQHPYSRDTTATGDSGNSHGGSVVRLEDSVASPSSAEATSSGSPLNTGTVLSDPRLVQRVLDIVAQRIDRPVDGSGTYSSDGASHLAFGGSDLPSYERSATSFNGTT